MLYSAHVPLFQKKSKGICSINCSVAPQFHGCVPPLSGLPKVTTLQGHTRDVLSISFDPEDSLNRGRLETDGNLKASAVQGCAAVPAVPCPFDPGRTIHSGALVMKASLSYGISLPLSNIPRELRLASQFPHNLNFFAPACRCWAPRASICWIELS